MNNNVLIERIVKMAKNLWNIRKNSRQKAQVLTEIEHFRRVEPIGPLHFLSTQ